jgi:hypothetical protein
MKTKKALLKELSNIPTEIIDLSFQIYKKMKQTKIPFFRNIDWMMELERIEWCLIELVEKGFLTRRQSRVFVRGIFDTLGKSDKARLRIASSYLKKKRGAPEDRPFNFLVFVLVRNSVRFTGKKRFKAIVELLQDREGICVTDTELRKRYRRLAKEAVRDTLIDYGMVDPEILKTAGQLMNIFFPPRPRLLSPLIEIQQRLMNSPSR